MCCPVYFMNSVSSCRCRHSAITLNPCALIPTFPCPPPHQCITESSFQCRQPLKCCLLQKSSTADFPAMIWPCSYYRICWRECRAQIADTNSFAGALNPHRSLLLLTWFNSLLLVLREAAATPLPFLQAPSKASFHSDLAHSSCSHVQSWVRINCNLIISWTIGVVSIIQTLKLLDTKHYRGLRENGSSKRLSGFFQVTLPFSMEHQLFRQRLVSHLYKWKLKLVFPGAPPETSQVLWLHKVGGQGTKLSCTWTLARLNCVTCIETLPRKYKNVQQVSVITTASRSDCLSQREPHRGDRHPNTWTAGVCTSWLGASPLQPPPQ